MATRALDLPVFIAIMYSTEGPSSPFFTYFMFALIVAILSWQSVGTLVTAAVALCAYFVLGYVSSQALEDSYFRLNRFIICAVPLGIVAILLSPATTSCNLPKEPDETRARLTRLGNLVAEERCDLRALIGDTRSERPASIATLDLGRRLADPAEQLRQQHGLEMKVRAGEETLGCWATAGAKLSRNVYYLAHEGLTNIVRHAPASRAVLSLTAENGGLCLCVADDGRGFPVLGRHDFGPWGGLGGPPAAMGRRVRHLGGDLVLESDESGSRIDISLPSVVA